MLQGSSRKITVIILAGITLVLLGLAVFIGIRLQETQAPEDTGAAGFGDDATDILYRQVDDLFADIPCEMFLPLGLANAISQATDTPMEMIWESVSGRMPVYLIPKDCNYRFEGGGNIALQANTYGVGAYVYQSEDEKFELVNSNVLDTVLDEALVTDGMIDYFFGTSKINPAQCVATVFHKQNEFNYIILTYSGFSSCQQVLSINQHLVAAMGSMIDKHIRDVTAANGFIFDRDGNQLIQLPN